MRCFIFHKNKYNPNENKKKKRQMFWKLFHVRKGLIWIFGRHGNLSWVFSFFPRYNRNYRNDPKITSQSAPTRSETQRKSFIVLISIGARFPVENLFTDTRIKNPHRCQLRDQSNASVEIYTKRFFVNSFFVWTFDMKRVEYIVFFFVNL